MDEDGICVEILKVHCYILPVIVWMCCLLKSIYLLFY